MISAEYTTIGEIADVKGGKRLKKGKVVQDEITDHPYMRVVDFREDGFDSSNVKYITEDAYRDVARYTIVPDEVYISIAGTIGRVGIIPPSFSGANLTENAAKITDINRAFDKRFLMYYLRSEFGQAEISSKIVGTSQPKLALFRIKEIRVPRFSTPHQKKIAAILSAYDDLIENNLRRIKILEEMAHTLYREWFVKFRFPGHQKFKMVNSPLGRIPEGWEVTPLSNLCIRITDGSHSSPKSVEMGYPMASVKDMRDWALDEESCRRIAEIDYQMLVRNDCKPLANDVLIAKDGSYLKHAFVIEEEKELVILSSIAILRPNLEQILPHILCMYLRQPEVRSRLSGYVSGVALPRIILKDFAKFLAVKPEMSLQTQFMMAVEPLVRLIHVLIKKNSTLRQTRDLLLPKVISGELDVSELDITIPEAKA